MKRGRDATRKPAADEIHETTTHGQEFPIVGIGASAGGLAAFEAFFSSIPTGRDLGMAFVIIQHLAPDHNSVLSELVRRYTPMAVIDVEDDMAVERNCAYIIPPNRDMTIAGGTLHLSEPTAPRGQRLPIDSFFRSLAADQHERAVGVVLSGTGSDGTQGIRAIKGEGGMVMAQDPDSTEFDGMPRSAIATSLVDYTLAPSDMPAELLAYVSHIYGPGAGAGAEAPRAGEALRAVFALLKVHTGHDFSQYKPNTIRRRIERRMSVRQVETIDAYAKVLNEMPAEVETLARELMIGVTSFFRDPACFSALAESIAKEIVSRKSSGDTIRVWSAGCSTGEEAYSIAMLLRESLDEANKECTVQVFGTDIDAHAIAVARAGSYPAGISADLSKDRLVRFFTREGAGATYKVTKSIRDMVIFSEQDIIKDPPFSRLDMISCRNVLIYMGSELQRKIIPVFHYALQTGGILFLGTSETIGEFGDLFATSDRTSKIFVRKERPRDAHQSSRSISRETRAATTGIAQSASEPESVPLETQLRRFTEQALLGLVAPAAVLVTADGVIRYFHGRTGLYLEPAPGEAGASNVLKMAREGLRHDLIVALHKAKSEGTPVVRRGLRVTTDGATASVDVTVTPVTPSDESAVEAAMFVVLFAPTQSVNEDSVTPGDSFDDATGRDAGIALLQRQLHEKDEYLRTTVEELETSNEELRSANEEMQSINEELQSTNEELETSKEELQSINEELSTVNAQLQSTVSDLSRSNNDMNNLLSGTGVGTVFVDHQLRILRFTPTVTEIINLIPGDIGRPVGHIVSNLVGYDGLVQDVQSVLDTLVPREAEVQTTDGQWYTLRVVPYRTTDNVIEGAVITFFNISEMVAARDQIDGLLRQKNILLREVHHRVKNNMNTIVSLLSLQSADLESQAAIDALKDAQSRVTAMALLYDRFYKTETLEHVPLGEYLEPLIRESMRSFPSRLKVDLDTAIEEITLDPERLFPLGLLANELFSNIVKYAFHERTSGKITVAASRVDRRVVLTIADDGVGMPESIDMDHTSGFGLTLVGLLANQLGGEMRIQRESGTRFVLEFDA